MKHTINIGSMPDKRLREIYVRSFPPPVLLNPDLIIPVYNLQNQARRPSFSALASNKYKLMPSLDAALDSFFLSAGVSEEAILTQTAKR